MDDAGRRGRQHEPSGPSTSLGRYETPEAAPTDRILANQSTERYRLGSMPTSSAASRGPVGPAAYGTYYQEPGSGFAATSMPSSTMTYGADYGSDSRQPASTFGSYSSTPMLYNVPQPGATQSQVYETQSFAGRPSSNSLQIMTPDVASTYFGTETSNAPGSSLQATGPGSSAQTTVYQQTNNLGFQGNISADASMADDPEYGDGDLEQRWNNYRRQIYSVYQDIMDGSLQNAAETLSGVSSWLLSQVVDLGKFSGRVRRTPLVSSLIANACQ